ncbi:MAG: M20/M25/M40 family metallo-hydrolase [Burkholderiales bacterium]|nr:M20/M25/M40 family metallo-hydrolase [Burkholderiales bacterium]
MENKIYQEVLKLWDQSTLPGLEEFVKLPALSTDFDKNWEKNGILLEAIKQADVWAQKLGIKGLKTEIVQDKGFTPCLLVDIAATEGVEGPGTVFMYGHLDKQPPNQGWDADKSPWKPVIQNGKLYGRGAVDDGYSFYTQLSAIKALQNLNIAHPRCVGLFESAEESSSPHYEEYLDEVKAKLGDVRLIIALDSSCGDYERLWITKSLRGMIGGSLEVKVLEYGVHSGEASGVVPSSFMIIRQLLDRIEDSSTGEIKGGAFNTTIFEGIRKDCQEMAEVLGESFISNFPWAGDTQPLQKTLLENVIARNWKPEMTVTGTDGLPSVEDAGNVLRPFTRIKIGMRLPPDKDAEKAALAFKKIMEENPPFGAQVTYTTTVASNGWTAGKTSHWLKYAFEEASMKYWGKPPCGLGMGASIPLLNVFSKLWPNAQFMAAGALGPHSNAHGPNEFLDIDYAQKLTASVALVIRRSTEFMK